MHIRPAIHSDRLALPIASDAETALIQANRTPQSVLRYRAKHKQPFLILGILRSVELIAHVPDVLPKLNRLLSLALERFLHVHGDHHGHEVTELRMRFNLRRGDVPMHDKRGLLAELINRLRSRECSSLRKNRRGGGECGYQDQNGE